MARSEESVEEIREAVSGHGFLMTAHADEEAREEDVSRQDIREAIANGDILEDYPAHRRGPCCLVYGRTVGGRDLHIVITRDKVPPRIITVYEPKPPQWITPRERRGGR